MLQALMNSKSDFVKTSLRWSIRATIHLRHKAGAPARTPEDTETQWGDWSVWVSHAEQTPFLHWSVEGSWCTNMSVRGHRRARFVPFSYVTCFNPVLLTFFEESSGAVKFQKLQTAPTQLLHNSCQYFLNLLKPFNSFVWRKNGIHHHSLKMWIVWLHIQVWSACVFEICIVWICRRTIET